MAGVRGQDQIHVLHVDTGREWRGGQAQVFGLLGALRDEPDLRLTLSAPPGSPLIERISALGLGTLALQLRGEWDLRSARALRDFALREGVHVIHAHDAHAHSLALRAVRRLPAVRLAVHRRVDFPVARGWFSRRKYGARVDQYVAISEGVARVLVRGGVPRGKITVIHSAIDPSKFDGAETTPSLREELGLAPDAPVIGTVGALVDHKGHRHLIEAMPAVLAARPDTRCVIVGEGELRGDLERRIRDLALGDKVLLAGWRSDVARCLDAFTLFCLPSHLEGLCTSLLDATLRRRPLVACAAGGVPEIVRDGETGWLVPVRDPAALAAGLLDALAHPDEAHRRAENAHRQTLEQFSLRRMADATSTLWRRLVAAG